LAKLSTGKGLIRSGEPSPGLLNWSLDAPSAGGDGTASESPVATTAAFLMSRRIPPTSRRA
jgi:hypothetical protein